MIQLIIFLVVVGLISYGIGKLLNKNKSDEKALASGCGVLLTILIMFIIGICIYGSTKKNNPSITVENIKNDLVKNKWYSGVQTISQIKELKITNEIKNDDLLEIQISANLESDKFDASITQFALKYEFNWLLMPHWTMAGMIPMK